jgi:NAD(P)H-flavin reductase
MFMANIIETKSRLYTNAADPMQPRPYSIKDVTTETYDTFTIELVPEQDGANPTFAPGQFNMLYVFGVGEVPISISGDPNINNQLTHTIRIVGTVTKALAQQKRNSILGVRGPFGTHWPIEEAKGKDIVIVAGGIGLAPIRPVIYQILSERDNYNRVTLLYGTRSPEDILFYKELEKWRSRFDLDVYVTVDHAKAKWQGHVGVVTTLINKATFDPINTVVITCGPEIMMKFTVQEVLRHGVKPEDIYVSMERNMKCAVGFCGHCQYGPMFICKDGPVFSFKEIEWLFGKREL